MPYNAYSIVQIDSEQISLKEAFEQRIIEPTIISSARRTWDMKSVKDPNIYGAIILGRDDKSYFPLDRGTYNTFARARLRDDIRATAREIVERMASDAAPVDAYALALPQDVWKAYRVGTIVEAVSHSDPSLVGVPLVVVSRLVNTAVLSRLDQHSGRGVLTCTRYGMRSLSILDARTFSVKREHGSVVWRLRHVADDARSEMSC